MWRALNYRARNGYLGENSENYLHDRLKLNCHRVCLIQYLQLNIFFLSNVFLWKTISVVERFQKNYFWKLSRPYMKRLPQYVGARCEELQLHYHFISNTNLRFYYHNDQTKCKNNSIYSSNLNHGHLLVLVLNNSGWWIIMCYI